MSPIHADEVIKKKDGDVSFRSANDFSIEPMSTAQYYWWKQKSNSFLKTESNGGYINQGPVFYIAQNGQTQCKTITSSAPTIGIDISIAGKVVAGGMSYSPGSNNTIVTTACSQLLTVSDWQAQYQKRYAVYEIVQE